MAYWGTNSGSYREGYSSQSGYSSYDAPDPPPNASNPVFASDAEYPSSSSRPAYVCMHSDCSAKPFNRSADLYRHVEQIHSDPSSKQSWGCDYSRCPRKSSGPFYRKDHFRDHLRDYHNEDLAKRLIKSSGSSKQDALDLAGRNISPKWWRCSRCLMRNTVPNWDCSTEGCEASCETERREARLKLQGTVGK